MKRNLPAHQSGIAALGDDRGAAFMTNAQDRGDLRGGIGLEQKGRAAMIFAAPFFQMRRDFVWIGGEGLGAHRIFQPDHYRLWYVHRGAAARLSRSLMASPMPQTGMGDTAICEALLSSSRSMAK